MKRSKKQRKILLYLVVVFGLTVGFALLSTTLKINGTAGVKSNVWDIHWDDTSVVESGNVTASIPAYVSDNEKKNVTFDVELELPGDYYEFVVDAKNYGTINGAIEAIRVKFYKADGIEEWKELPSYYKYSFTYADGSEIVANDVLEAGQSKSYKFRIEYDSDATTIPGDGDGQDDDDDVIKPVIEIDATQTRETDHSTYKINFNPNGGEVDPTSKSINAGDVLGELPTPIKDSSIFDGWYTSLTSGIKVDESYVPEGNLNLIAKWKEKRTIQLNANGGSVNPTFVEAYDGDVIDNLPVPHWEEHTYTGWYTGITEGIKIDFPYTVSEDVTLYARWTGWVFVNEDTSASLQDQEWSYYQDGIRIESGFANLEDFYGSIQKYYFENGIAHKGWLHINDDHYYFSDNDEDGNGYVNCGAYHSEIKEIDGNMYAFDADGKCINYDEYLRCQDNINLTLDSHEECPNNKNITLNSGVVCKRAEYLHQEKCQDDTNDSWYCAGDGYLAEGATHSGQGYIATELKDTDIITYGNCGTQGSSINAGDAFTCDVNADGIFNEDTERFYYVSDYYNTKTQQFESDTAVLIFYINMYNGLRCNQDDRQVFYNNTERTVLNGPQDNLINQLPTITKWSNVSLKNTNRAILSENRDTHDSPTAGGAELPTNYSYSGYSTRLLTAKELMRGCNISRIPVNNTNSTGDLSSCIYLLENTKYAMYNDTYIGYWLETPITTVKYAAWYVDSPFRKVASQQTDYYQTQLGARPVIEVPKTKIAY